MSFLAVPAAKAAATIGTNLLASRLSGSSGSQAGGVQQFQPVGFSGGGLEGTFDDGRFDVSATGKRKRAVESLSSLFPQQANLTAGLRGLVSPGIGALTTSRLEELNNRGRVAIGNLRENLSRRRVLGSSFGQDALQRAELGVAQEADRIRAESFLQELDLTNQLIQQEFNTRRGEFTTQLNDLNIQAELAANLSNNASSQLAANARLKEQLNAKEASSSGSFFGQAFQPVISAIGNRIGTQTNLAQIGQNFANSTTVR